MTTKTALILFALFCFVTSCTSKQLNHSQWEDNNAWYENTQSVNENLADVFYVVSTNVVSATDGDGNEVWNALLTEQDRSYYKAEMDYAKNMFSDSLNFFSPYYHQATLNNFSRPDTEQAIAQNKAIKEVIDAFDYYMKHLNGGRRFILAGFSQGALITIELLKHMTDEQYSRLIAAYVIGYRLSAEDVAHKNIKPATDQFSNGVSISFNSVESPAGIWPEVSEGATTCINPLNWKTDDSEAQLIFEGDTATVSVNTKHNVLIVDNLEEGKYIFAPFKGIVNEGNLHHWDILFYNEAIRRNALDRAYK